jgi:tetratricopeptide (TPR) repeat protein
MPTNAPPNMTAARTVPIRSPAQRRPAWLAWMVALVLATATVATFQGVRECGFILLDDPDYVTENPVTQQGLTWRTVVWAFTHTHASNWHPLSWLSHALDCQLFGLAPSGHHLTSLWFHTLNALLLFYFLRRTTGSLWRSALVSALFALHPLRVESVAWIAERKDVLSGCFFFLTLIAYQRYVRLKSERAGSPILAYSLALFAFALGLMSKPMLVTVPFLLLLLDWWPLHRITWPLRGPWRAQVVPLLVEKVPFLLLTIASCWATLKAQRGAMLTVEAVPLIARLGNAAKAATAYLGDSFWPQALAVLYPYPPDMPGSDAVLATLLLAAICTVAILGLGRLPFLATGFFWYLGMLVPVIGIVQVGQQCRADRYTYLPTIGIGLLVVWTVARLLENRPIMLRSVSVASVVALVALGTTTTVQVKLWRDSLTLFMHTVKVTQNNYSVLAWLGSLQLRAGNVSDAKNSLEQALGLSPNHPMANYYRGLACQFDDRWAEAIPYLQRAAGDPHLDGPRHCRLGLSFMATGQLDEAARELEQALALMPMAVDTRMGLAALARKQGRLADAERSYRGIITNFPTFAVAHRELGDLLQQANRPIDAEAAYHKAVELEPLNPAHYYALAAHLGRENRPAEAAGQMQALLSRKPGDIQAYIELGQWLGNAGRPSEAKTAYLKAIELAPQSVAALNNLAWLLATHPDDRIRDGTLAVQLAQEACKLTGWELPLAMGTLAAAYAETGRFDDAQTMAGKAKEKALALSLDDLASRNEELRGLYLSRRAFRDHPSTSSPSTPPRNSH